MRTFRYWPLAGTLLAVCNLAQAADAFSNLPFALLGGTPNLDARARYERVESEAAATPKNADALTLRARLGYTTGKWNDLDAQLEYEGVTAYDENAYNSGSNGVTNRPVIADPVGNELNQAWLRYGGLPWTTIKIGRQRYTLDNQRFIGNAGWRQNEQTYDGASALIKPLPQLEVNYAYFHNVNTVKFKDIPMHKVHLLNAAYSFGDFLKLSAYGYWLDFKATSAVANAQDSQTLGLRAIGSRALGDALKLSYVAEYAQQRHYADAPDSVDANYWTIEAGLAYDILQAKLGYEVLGSHDGAYGFQTPLATLHAFNGWADQFLVTPATGLKDRYASLSATQWRTTATLVYHRYDADQGGADFGSEWNASLSRPLSKQLAVLAKYARYDAKSFSADTQKYWLQAEFKF